MVAGLIWHTAYLYTLTTQSYCQTVGVMDSSGVEFFYTSEPREHEAGILNLGYNVNRLMVIPPNTPRYDVIGYCDPQCTSRVSGLAGLEEIYSLISAWLN